MYKPLTIKDVAKKAKVSVSTVSRVINGLDRVKPETHRRVMEAIEELNFVPDKTAVSMVKKETKTIVLLVPDTMNPFYTAVIQGAENEARKDGYLLFVCSTNDDPHTEESYINELISKNVDGFIIIPCQESHLAYSQIQKPIVFVDRNYLININHSVTIDNFGGSYQAAQHLIDYGHERIAIIYGEPLYLNQKERFWGFERALRDNGLPVSASYVKEGDWLEEHGYKSTVELLSLDNPPTAIFSANNLICKGSIKAIRDLQLKLAEDISLVGFDDHELASFMMPPVTVIDRPNLEMGKAAAEILLRSLKNKNSEQVGQKVVLGTSLIERSSVKKIKK
ncbi:LacI family DNA-binding transcriptional regulator [Paenibacillus sp. TH7-28]